MDDCEELCKVGDKLYRVSKKGVVEATVVRIEHYPHCVYRLTGTYDSCFNRAFGQTIFKTYEEAEEATRIRDKISEKRKLLKIYEKELNEKLGLKDHKIVQ